METDRFDRLVRTPASAPSRRGVLQLLTAGALATLVWDAAAGRGKKPCQPKCKTCQKCRRGNCKPNKKQNGKRCANGKVCQSGRCVPLPCGNGVACRVFVTEAGHVGSEIGGLEGGDAICQDAARAAGLKGTFLAWLSDDTDSPANRFSNRGKAGPYQLVPNQNDAGNPPPTIVASFTALTSCAPGADCLQHPINRVEDGRELGQFEDVPVWTGTRPDGTPAGKTCGGWTKERGGAFGSSDQVDAGWTQSPSGGGTCTEAISLYCFEQA